MRVLGDRKNWCYSVRSMCRYFSHWLLTIAFLISVLSAQGPSKTPSVLPGKFVDVTSKLGINFKQEASPTAKKYLLETMGSGLALFDYDNDGRLDIFLGNGARIDDPMARIAMPIKDGPKFWDRLYHQRPDGTFEDVTEKAGLKGTGYVTGVAVGDYDNDGHEDLFVAAYGRNTLYHNNGNGTFTDVTDTAGVAGGGWPTSTAWVDYDNDGKLDLVIAQYMEWSFDDIYCGNRGQNYRAYCHPDLFKASPLRLYHNEGGGKFRDVVREAGADRPCKGLGVAIADYDRDGLIDIFIANDAIPEALFHNEGNGKFKEVAMETGVAVDGNGATFSGMGVDFADYNNDGWPDLIVTDLANQRYALYTNGRDGTFDYSSLATGIGAMTMHNSGWGVRFMDYDNDGWKDLFIVQSHVLDTIETELPNLRYREPPQLARNTGKGFVSVASESGDVFQQKWAARSLAMGDINRDGKLDVVINSNNGPAWVLFNETSTTNHWVNIELVGVKSNRDGIGAAVSVHTTTGDQFRTVTTASSYQSSSDKRVHFGLGPASMIDRIEVRWPSGIMQTLKNVQADQFLTITEEMQPSK